MTTTTTQPNTQLTNLFKFADAENTDNRIFMEEVGTLIFQSALMMYMVETDAEEATAFEKFIEGNVDSELFIEKLCAEYPLFEKILSAEMNAFYVDLV